MSNDEPTITDTATMDVDECQEANADTTSDLNFQALRELTLDNAEYFRSDRSETGQTLCTSFSSVACSIDELLSLAKELRVLAPRYDFDEHTPGNGCRSYLLAVDRAVALGVTVSSRITSRRYGVLFRKGSASRDVEAFAGLLKSLESYGNFLRDLLSWTQGDDLFACSVTSLDELLSSEMDLKPFYGRNLGFQFCESMRPILRFVGLSMVIFSEAYYSRGSFFSKARNSVTTTAKYLTDPEERARRIVNIYQNASVDFLKSLWFLAEGELMRQVPSVVGQNVAVSKIIHIPPEEMSVGDIDVPIPQSYIGKRPVQVRLISYDVREGMIGEGQTRSKILPPSRGLLIHCHGGGFISQSSMSHDSYLREWAKELQVPILSIDYSLAPEAPYPRALEEVTYAYCWALNNHKLLGSTGERIVMAGDSAGGNLLAATNLKCISMGLPVPSGLFLAYTPIWLTTNPTPSRMLCLFDPLLPLGFITRCLNAYVSKSCFKNGELINGTNGTNGSDTESFEEISQSDLVELQAHKSPISEASDTITYGSLNSPIVDDSKFSLNGVDTNELDANISDFEHSTSQRVNGSSDFLERYVLDSDTDTDGTKVAVLQQENINVSTIQEEIPSTTTSSQFKITSFVSGLRERFGKWVSGRPSHAELYLDSWKDKDNFYGLRKVEMPEDPFISPYLATEDLLKKMPPVTVVSLNMDPCLDDCVMFARKLKRAGNPVVLDILDGLPHGFLNFTLISKESAEASRLCIKRMKELFDLESLPPLLSSQSEN